MFGLDITLIAFIVLAALGAGAVVYAIFFNTFANEANQKKRVKNINERDQVRVNKAAARINDAAKRRQTVQNSLKELEEKQAAKHKKKLPLKKILQQAGLKIDVRQFYILSVVCGLVCAVLALISGGNMIIIGGALIVGTLGLPRWTVSYLRNKRFKQFLEELPNAVEVIVRGVKAGLPLNDCIMIIAKEAKDPVRTEFARILEAQQIGMTMSEAVTKLYDNIPLPESNFFGIVISIQQSAGGNLSEALGNLAAVLRDRKKMKAKINAMSAEAKASAGIIGSLPFIVAFLVYLTTPDYIMLLFTDQTGNMILLGAGIWMSIGIMVMRNMINFDF